MWTAVDRERYGRDGLRYPRYGNDRRIDARAAGDYAAARSMGTAEASTSRSVCRFAAANGARAAIASLIPAAETNTKRPAARPLD